MKIILHSTNALFIKRKEVFSNILLVIFLSSIAFHIIYNCSIDIPTQNLIFAVSMYLSFNNLKL